MTIVLAPSPTAPNQIRYLGFTELMNAVYTRLTTSAYTSAYTIYNYVPTFTQAMFYITFGSPIGGRSASFGNRDQQVEENVIMINIWSDYPGDKEANNIMMNVMKAMTGSNLSLAGYGTPAMLLYEYGEVVVDTSESAVPIRHGVMRFRVTMAS